MASTAFEALAHLQARAMGYPDLRILVIQHPLGGIPPEEVLQKVPDAVAEVDKIAGLTS